MTSHRLEGDGYFLKIDPVSGRASSVSGRASSLARSPKDATEFPTAKAAREARDRALGFSKKAFASFFPAEKAPNISISGFHSPAQMWPPKALSEAIRLEQISVCSAEAFGPPAPPLAALAGLPSLFGVLSAYRKFARQGNTGYTTFVEVAAMATFFHSAKAAQAYFNDCAPTREAEPSMIGAHGLAPFVRRAIGKPGGVALGSAWAMMRGSLPPKDPMTQELSLYEQVLGAQAYARLAPALRDFHRLSGSHVRVGTARTAPPTTFAAKLIARLLGTPREAASGAFRFELDASPGAEVWTRQFPALTMVNKMSLVDGMVGETLGVSRMTFSLAEEDGALSMKLLSLVFAGIPCPAWLMPNIVAIERGVGDEVHFTVQATMPFFGVVVSHSGRFVATGPGA